MNRLRKLFEDKHTLGCAALFYNTVSSSVQKLIQVQAQLTRNNEVACCYYGCKGWAYRLRRKITMIYVIQSYDK